MISLHVFSRGKCSEILRAAEEIGITGMGHTRVEFSNSATAAFQGVCLAVVVLSDSSLEIKKEVISLISRLRERQPNCRVIAMSSQITERVGVEALISGADDFVCADWEQVNWKALLQQRLLLWKNLLEIQIQRDTKVSNVAKNNRSMA